MDGDNNPNVPYIVHEAIVTRLERIIKRLWILCLVLVLCLVGTNAAWVYYESQFMEIEMDVQQENERGLNNFIGNDGNINLELTDGPTDNQD